MSVSDFDPLSRNFVVRLAGFLIFAALSNPLHAQALAPPPPLDDAQTVAAPAQTQPVYGPPKAVTLEHPQNLTLDWAAAPASAPSALVRALEIVTRTYPSVRGARAAINAAASDVKGAQWQRFPNISVQTSFVGTGNTIAPSVSLAAPIWAAGKLGANIKRARAGLNASEAQYREVVLGLAVDTSQTYFDIARLTRREALITESLDEHLSLRHI